MSSNIVTSYAKIPPNITRWSPDNPYFVPYTGINSINVSSITAFDAYMSNAYVDTLTSLDIQALSTTSVAYQFPLGQNKVALPATRLITSTQGVNPIVSAATPIPTANPYILEVGCEYDVSVKGAFLPATAPGTPNAGDIIYANVALASGSGSTQTAISYAWYLPSVASPGANNTDTEGTTASNPAGLSFHIRDRLYIPSTATPLAQPTLSVSVPFGQTTTGNYQVFVYDFTINRVA